MQIYLTTFTRLPLAIILSFIFSSGILPLHTTLAQAQTTAGQLLSYTDVNGNVHQLSAFADTDGDGIENALEINGFVFDLLSGELTEWDGDPNKEHFFTDPLRASTDGDPYSDLMEVTGANMPGSVNAPFNHPLVAARPIIAVFMENYEVIPNGEITDSEGGSISDSYTNETSLETTAGVTVSASVELSPFSLGEASLESSFSQTYASTNSSTSESSFDWSSARSVAESEAARLRLNVYYLNLGSAPASNVRPTFLLKLGNKVIATFQSSQNSEALVMAPGGRFPASGTIAVDSYVAGEVDREITLSLEELKAIQRGAPLRLVVPQVEATINRWDEQTQSFSNEITWSAFEEDINSVSLTLQTEIGDEAVQYQVYAGSPQFDEPQRNLRETLELLFDVEDRNGVTYIADRRYPESWYTTTDSEAIISEWKARGEPQNMLGLPMPRGNTMVMLSPGDAAAPRVDYTTYSSDLQYVYTSARPISGLPIQRAYATLFLEQRTIEIPLDVDGSGAFISNSEPIDQQFYGGFVTVLNARNEGQVVDLIVPRRTTAFTTCQDVKQSRFGDTSAGRVPLFMTGEANRAVDVFCNFGSSNEKARENPWTAVQDTVHSNLYDVHVVDEKTILRSSAVNHLERSTDGGTTWEEVSTPLSPMQFIRAFYFHDEINGFAVGSDGNILKTTSAGASWNRIPQPFSTESLAAIDFFDELYGIVVGSKGTVLRTEDGGENWVPLDINGAADDRFNYGTMSLSSVDYITRDRIAITSYDSILMSFDGGITWDFHLFSEMGLGTSTGPAKKVAFPTRSTGYAARGPSFSSQFIAKTTDGGKSWSPLAIPDDVHYNNFHFFDANNGILTGSNDVIYHTIDGGLTWVEQYTSKRNIHYDQIHFKGGKGILVARKLFEVSQNTFRRENYLFYTTPVDLTAGPEGEPPTIRPKPLLMYNGSPSKINGALSIDTAAETLGQYGYVVLGQDSLMYSGRPGYEEMVAILAHPAMEETKVYGRVDAAGALGRSDTDIFLETIYWNNAGADGVFLDNMGYDDATTREQQNKFIDFARRERISILVSATHFEDVFSDNIDSNYNPGGEPTEFGPNDLYLWRGYQIEDGQYINGNDWRETAERLRDYRDVIEFSVLSLATASQNTSYDENQFHYAWHSALIDGHKGIGWAENTLGTNDEAPFRKAPDVTPGRTFFGDIETELPFVRRSTQFGDVEVNVNSHTFTFGTTVVETGTDEEVLLPTSIELKQNYPNPFVQRTQIPFEITTAADVRLEVFDLLGRRIAVVVNETMLPGRHEVPFDASRIASGVYLYRLVAGERQETKRMLVVK